MSETMIPNWPDAIRCGAGSAPGAVFLLQSVNSGNGYYVQVFPYELRRVWFDGNGNYGDRSGHDDSSRGCLGQSIAQLYESGRAFNLLTSIPFDDSNTMVQGWPDAMRCGYDTADGAVFFLHAVSESEGAFYVQNYPLEYREVRFDLDGSFNSRTGTELVTGGCHGRSIDELSVLDRTFSLVSSRTMEDSDNQTMIPNWPDAIICGSGDDIKSIFYLHGASDSGGYYVQPYNNEYRYIRFNGDGTYESMLGNEVATRACLGQSIEQLYESGRAFNLVGSIQTTTTEEASTTSTEDETTVDVVYSEGSDSGYSQGFIAGMVVLGAAVVGVAIAGAMRYFHDSGSAALQQ